MGLRVKNGNLSSKCRFDNLSSGSRLPAMTMGDGKTAGRRGRRPLRSNDKYQTTIGGGDKRQPEFQMPPQPPLSAKRL